jgi:hypothetical protein
LVGSEESGKEKPALALYHTILRAATVRSDLQLSLPKGVYLPHKRCY